MSPCEVSDTTCKGSGKTVTRFDQSPECPYCGKKVTTKSVDFNFAEIVHHKV